MGTSYVLPGTVTIDSVVCTAPSGFVGHRAPYDREPRSRQSMRQLARDVRGTDSSVSGRGGRFALTQQINRGGPRKAGTARLPVPAYQSCSRNIHAVRRARSASVHGGGSTWRVPFRQRRQIHRRTYSSRSPRLAHASRAAFEARVERIGGRHQPGYPPYPVIQPARIERHWSDDARYA